MGATPIEWADHSINPFRARNIETGKVGHFCVKISPGYKNCYSSKMQKPHLTQLEFVAENRPKVELFLERKALNEVLRRKKPTEYFWCDMTDMFLEDYPDDWIDQCFATMALTPWHKHMVLTKRADRMLKWFAKPSGFSFTWREGYIQNAAYKLKPDAHFALTRWPLPNVRIGVSVENQEQAAKRIPLLLQTPAAVRFLSVEPLLEDLGALDLAGIDWVIVGGESGPGARPCNTDWVQSIVDQCKAAGVPCFVKQLGAHVIQGGERRRKKDRKGGDPNEWPHELRVREFPEARA